MRIGYPALDDEIVVLERQQYHHPVEDLDAVVVEEDVLQAQEAIKAVHVSPAVKRYIVELIDQTRNHQDVYLGASPRGSLTLYRTGQARAALQGRDFVLPDDVKALALPALAHRVILSPRARLRELTSESVVQEILDSLPVPGGDMTRKE